MFLPCVLLYYIDIEIVILPPENLLYPLIFGLRQTTVRKDFSLFSAPNLRYPRKGRSYLSPYDELLSISLKGAAPYYEFGCIKASRSTVAHVCEENHEHSTIPKCGANEQEAKSRLISE